MQVNDQPELRSETTDPSMLDLTERLDAVESLVASERRYRALIDTTSDGIFLFEADGTIRSINRAGERLFGRTAEQMDNVRAEDLLHPDDVAQVTEALESIAQLPGESVEVLCRFRRADGSWRWGEARGTNAFEDPDLRGYVIVLRDVTDRVEAEQALRRSLQRLEMMHDIDYAILEGRSTGEMAHRVVEQLAAVLEGERVSVLVFDAARSEVRFLGVAQSGDVGPAEGTVWSMAEFSPGDEVPRPHEPTYIPDLAALPDRPASLDYLHANGIRTLLNCPLHVADRLIGELNVCSRRVGDFAPKDREVVSEIADLLAIGIEQTSLRESLEERARTLEEHVVEFRRTDQERHKLLEQLVAAEEKERRAIADGLHDDSIQRMVAVGIRLETLHRQLIDPAHLDSVAELTSVVSQTISRLRLLLFELHPRSLEDGRLGDTIREYLELSADPDGPSYAFQDMLEERLPLEVRTTAYRIIQEALANARKHAKAAHVAVQLEARDEGVYGRVWDDGVGIATKDQPSTPGHIGLVAMRDRADRLGGWARVSPAEEAGTTVEFWLPMSQERPYQASGPGSSPTIVATTAE